MVPPEALVFRRHERLDHPVLGIGAVPGAAVLVVRAEADAQQRAGAVAQGDAGGIARGFLERRVEPPERDGEDADTGRGAELRHAP